MHFREPVRTLEAWSLEEVQNVLQEAVAAQSRGLNAIGWIAYEAAPAFDPALPRRRPPDGIPYARFSIYPTQYPGLPRRIDPPPFQCDSWKDRLSARDFAERVERIRGAIAAGETYQVNFTAPAFAPFSGSAWSLFRALRTGQSAQHQAYLDEGDRVVISASPELFFHLKNGRICCRPMKGTAPPGQEIPLRDSPKNRAENIMIVDMIRNDLGKCAESGSVKVSRLFAIESYPSLLQMTSTVEAHTSGRIWDILRALFPCASITGAPKRQTMRWIQELEPDPRGIYTGAIGGLYADGTTEFNVAIRTAVLDRITQTLRYDTGCGIVWDSDPEEEYQESRLKARILREPARPVQLIETMKVLPGEGCALWPRHRHRLLRSSAALGFAVLTKELDAAFDHQIQSLQVPTRLRLLVDMDGGLIWSQHPLPAEFPTLRVGLDTRPTLRNHPQLKHKTTGREVYRDARSRRPDVDDTLLINEDGELMEFTIGSVVLERQGRRLTPPLASGLLPGTAREALLEAGQIHEAVLTVSDLQTMEKLYLLNAVRGLTPVTLAHSSHHENTILS